MVPAPITDDYYMVLEVKQDAPKAFQLVCQPFRGEANPRVDHYIICTN